jgi:hypothetical protein
VTPRHRQRRDRGDRRDRAGLAEARPDREAPAEALLVEQAGRPPGGLVGERPVEREEGLPEPAVWAEAGAAGLRTQGEPLTRDRPTGAGWRGMAAVESRRAPHLRRAA